MKTNSFSQTWDDLVFEFRNKGYGAYLLRKTYPDRVLTGLLATVFVVAAILALQLTAFNDSTLVSPPLVERGLRTLALPPSILQKPKVIQAPRVPRKSNTRSNTVVVTREEVEDVKVDDVSTDILSDGDVHFDFDGSDMGVVDGIATDISFVVEPVNEPLDLAEVMPEYEGGIEAMMKFIQKKIRYPRAPQAMGIDGTVYVRFVVNGDGSISDVQVIRGIHRDYDREAARVISLLPGWKGGRHGGRPVPVRMVLPIRFNLQ